MFAFESYNLLFALFPFQASHIFVLLYDIFRNFLIVIFNVLSLITFVSSLHSSVAYFRSLNIDRHSSSCSFVSSNVLSVFSK